MNWNRLIRPTLWTSAVLGFLYACVRFRVVDGISTKLRVHWNTPNRRFVKDKRLIIVGDVSHTIVSSLLNVLSKFALISGDADPWLFR
jgi:hypothetical protein